MKFHYTILFLYIFELFHNKKNVKWRAFKNWFVSCRHVLRVMFKANNVCLCVCVCVCVFEGVWGVGGREVGLFSVKSEKHVIRLSKTWHRNEQCSQTDWRGRSVKSSSLQQLSYGLSTCKDDDCSVFKLVQVHDWKWNIGHSKSHIRHSGTAQKFKPSFWVNNLMGLWPEVSVSLGPRSHSFLPTLCSSLLSQRDDWQFHGPLGEKL